jgi:hypothetical protein
LARDYDWQFFADFKDFADVLNGGSQNRQPISAARIT